MLNIILVVLIIIAYIGSIVLPFLLKPFVNPYIPLAGCLGVFILLVSLLLWRNPHLNEPSEQQDGKGTLALLSDVLSGIFGKKDKDAPSSGV
ncbi:hypothetical protein FWH30_00215 [Microgenomates group bacterium]|nr:hypothetical protein [Microgenomates group bacterium]